MSNPCSMIRPPIATTVASSKDPNHFPHSGTALVVRLLADRVNGLAVVDALLPWDSARSKMGVALLEGRVSHRIT